MSRRVQLNRYKSDPTSDWKPLISLMISDCSVFLNKFMVATGVALGLPFVIFIFLQFRDKWDLEFLAILRPIYLHTQRSNRSKSYKLIKIRLLAIPKFKRWLELVRRCQTAISNVHRCLNRLWPKIRCVVQCSIHSLGHSILLWAMRFSKLGDLRKRTWTKVLQYLLKKFFFPIRL